MASGLLGPEKAAAHVSVTSPVFIITFEPEKKRRGGMGVSPDIATPNFRYYATTITCTKNARADHLYSLLAVQDQDYDTNDSWRSYHQQNES